MSSPGGCPKHMALAEVAAHKEDTKGRPPLAVVVGEAPKAAIADIVGPAAVATRVPGNKVAPEQ